MQETLVLSNVVNYILSILEIEEDIRNEIIQKSQNINLSNFIKLVKEKLASDLERQKENLINFKFYLKKSIAIYGLKPCLVIWLKTPHALFI